ncbi:MAG: hypothetical protein GY941_20730 [Planctomycetes bacterium]|nr:hypothetical protein [Planctomycetota bacterium]
MACNRTQERLINVGVKGAAGIAPSADEKWGGGELPTIGADDGYRVTDVSLPNETVETFENDETSGGLGKFDSLVVGKPVNDGISGYVSAEAIGKILFPSMGYADLSGLWSDGGSKYAHIFETRMIGKDQCHYTASEAAKATANTSLDPAYDSSDIVNCELNFLKTLGPADYKVGNLRVQSLKIAGASGEPWTFEISGPAEVLEKDDTKAESGNLTTTAADFTDRANFRNTVCEVSGSVVAIHAFEINEAWSLADGRYPTGTANDGLSIAEPFCTDGVTVEGSFVVDKHDTLDFEADQLSGAIKTLKFENTDSSSNMIGLYFPAIQYTSTEIDKSDGSKINVSFKAVVNRGPDPFPNERTIDSTEISLEYADTLFYAKLLNTKTVNYMRLQ